MRDPFAQAKDFIALPRLRALIAAEQAHGHLFLAAALSVMLHEAEERTAQDIWDWVNEDGGDIVRDIVTALVIHDYRKRHRVIVGDHTPELRSVPEPVRPKVRTNSTRNAEEAARLQGILDTRSANR